jgi:hemolysin activation/secretion protein
MTKSLTFASSAALLLAGACGTVYAQSAAPQSASTAQSSPAATQASAPRFAIRGFNIKGNNPLDAGVTSQVLAPFLRSDATLETLQKATAALEAALRDAGFGLHKVALPPQEVGDTVTLEIVRFSLGQIEVAGNQHHSAANIRASVPELQEGGAPNFKKLAVQTALANENPGKQLSVTLKASADKPDQIDALLTVKDSKPWFVGLSANNAGNRSTGRDRSTLSTGHSNLWGRDHQFVAAYTTSLERSKDVKQIGLNYRMPFYGLGGTLGLSHTRSDVAGTFGNFTSTGAGKTTGLNYTWALAPEGGSRSFVSLSWDDRLFEASQIDGTPVGVDRRSRPVSVNYTRRQDGQQDALAYSVELSLNTGGGRGNSAQAYASEYSNPVTGQGIRTAAFKILRGNVNYTRMLGTSQWLWSARSGLQWSPDALISGEQMGLGGVASVRGAPDRAISGDRGLQASLELNTPELAPGLRLTGFVDAGWLSNRDADGVRRVSSDHLSSVGLGLRYANSSVGLSIQMDYGRLLTGSKLPLATNSSAPQKGDDKSHVSVSIRF